ncbi:hypothetical protein ES703_05458 [subsurface metagenome]
MNCPFYEEITIRYCKALAKRIMIPSGSEKERFCICKKFKECPLYKEYTENKSKHPKIPENKKGVNNGNRPKKS